MSGDPSDAQGNLATALNEIFGQQGRTINQISDLIGAVADVSGAIGGIISFFQWLTNEGEPDEIQIATQDIENTINRVFTALNQTIILNEIIKRNSDLQSYLSPAETQLQQLQAHISSNGTAAEISDWVGACITTLNNFAGPTPNEAWDMPADSWPHWTDAGTYESTCFVPLAGFPGEYNAVISDVGYGEQVPPSNADGTVFIPVNSLPMFLSSF